ncbi:MAG TPA: DNA mismatch repair endonuclease MutL [Porphyromonadaceae bacterium]|nr:DNA mismatch repair endonuclease MutL [Porphyromonadaceae bacterium]
MSKDVIQLLPDSVANQIAAGEVVQRPASVVKELMENAIDAGATSISVYIKEAGRSLICVSDNGCGMSESDARMAFERHATSKIHSSQDMFSLHTMGFRGEALPSIVSVSQVELKTCQKGEKLGTKLCFNGSSLESHEYIQFPEGSCFSVKNLFFNVPARRKFLKSNQRELSCIIEEFEKIALANTNIDMLFVSDDKELYNLKSSNVLQRIVSIFGKHFREILLPVELESTILNLKGYVSTPQGCIKKNLKQFFFVNGRYMRNSYFHKAVLHSFENLIQKDESPHYFLFLDVDPSTIDVNIHPTKTEISFENALPIWQMITASIKKTLGKNNAVPSIDFNQEDAVDIPPFEREDRIVSPTVNLDTSYNPFKTFSRSHYSNPSSKHWERLYMEKPQGNEPPNALFEKNTDTPYKESFLILHKKYLLLQQRENLLILHIKRAQQRICYDNYLKRFSQKKECGERLLFPEMLHFSASDSILLDSIEEDLFYMGFEISCLGGGTYSINSTPEGIKPSQEMFDKLLEDITQNNLSIKEELNKSIALSLSEWVVKSNTTELLEEEIPKLEEQLFSSSDPYHTPKGKKILTLISEDHLDKMF